MTTTVQLGPFSRKTISAATIPELVNRSFGIIVDAPQPVVAERAMYFGSTATRPWSGGGAAAGATAPSVDWYFAEGATGTFFDTFLLLMNPDATNDAHVTLRYLLDTGETIEVPKVVPAQRAPHREHRDRRAIRGSTPRRCRRGLLPIVRSSPSARSTGRPGKARSRGANRTSRQGVTAAGPRWALAEGRTGGALNFHTYILLGNPGTQAAEVTVEFLPQTGAPVVKTYNVPARSRFTIDATIEAPAIQDGSFITLISTAAACRSWWNARSTGTARASPGRAARARVATRLPEPE